MKSKNSFRSFDLDEFVGIISSLPPGNTSHIISERPALTDGFWETHRKLEDASKPYRVYSNNAAYKDWEAALLASHASERFGPLRLAVKDDMILPAELNSLARGLYSDISSTLRDIQDHALWQSRMTAYRQERERHFDACYDDWKERRDRVEERRNIASASYAKDESEFDSSRREGLTGDCPSRAEWNVAVGDSVNDLAAEIEEMDKVGPDYTAYCLPGEPDWSDVFYRDPSQVRANIRAEFLCRSQAAVDELVDAVAHSRNWTSRYREELKYV